MNSPVDPSTGNREGVVQHTPGPWFVCEKGFAKKGLWSAPTVYAADDELRYIAVCACADFGNFHSATNNLANARLIAACPTMYDYISARAAEGDARAAEIVEAIHATV